MTLDTELYSAQTARWPKTGRHILAQFDDESVVYQTYRPRGSDEPARWGSQSRRLSAPLPRS